MGRRNNENIDSIAEIRQQGSLTDIISEEPDAEIWLNQAYAKQDIVAEIRNLPNRKAHGDDGLPGEDYNAARQWAIEPFTRIMNQIKDGQSELEDCENGSIVYIYKNKGGAGECKNYRPIFLTQIICKIWSGLIARQLTKITHNLKGNKQYAYKEGISTIGAILKTEQYRQ